MEDKVELPGFRFHPTEEELLNFYLKTTVLGEKLRIDIIGILNIYNHHPAELPGVGVCVLTITIPGLAKIGEREWYFFVPRGRKHGNGGRPNRTTQNGFWKATGSDRKIFTTSHPKKMLGYKKTLVFYEGRAPRGTKTDWIMNEYRLPEINTSFHSLSPPKDIVLCKIYTKATSLKVLELRAAMEEPHAPISFCNQIELVNATMSESNKNMGFKKENEDDITTLVTVEEETFSEACNNNYEGRGCTYLVLPNGKENLPDLQLPRLDMDWSEDIFWTQLRSQWLDNYTPFLPMC